MRVSVVIPTRNRPDSLHRLLGTLARQTLRSSDDSRSAEPYFSAASPFAPRISAGGTSSSPEASRVSGIIGNAVEGENGSRSGKNAHPGPLLPRSPAIPYSLFPIPCLYSSLSSPVHPCM
jgi:hypothetical protein